MFIRRTQNSIEVIKEVALKMMKSLSALYKVGKHIEIQVARDTYGNCIHLFERDCSSQRGIVVLEEAPALSIPTTKQKMYKAAIDIANKIDIKV